jgi:hypothetical protein
MKKSIKRPATKKSIKKPAKKDEAVELKREVTRLKRQVATLNSKNKELELNLRNTIDYDERKEQKEENCKREIEQWTCDSCGKLIENAGDGWVEWVAFTGTPVRPVRDLRLVHRFKQGCRFNKWEEFEKDGGIVGDWPLKDFLGHDGLMFLLSYIEDEDAPVTQLLEMIKRLHIPFYEKTRRYFEQAVAANVIYAPYTRPGYYTQSQIKDVLRYIDSLQNPQT